MPARIPIPKEAIAAFCERHHIRKLSLFGSVLRADFNPESDIDVLVEFEKGHRVGLMSFVTMQYELSDLLGREVHLNTVNDLSPYFREDVVDLAEVQYEHA